MKNCPIWGSGQPEQNCCPIYRQWPSNVGTLNLIFHIPANNLQIIFLLRGAACLLNWGRCVRTGCWISIRTILSYCSRYNEKALAHLPMTILCTIAISCKSRGLPFPGEACTDGRGGGSSSEKLFRILAMKGAHRRNQRPYLFRGGKGWRRLHRNSNLL